jgi:hypothetical protein
MKFLLLFFLAFPAYAVDLHIAPNWGAKSVLWDGEQTAVCIEPGSPTAVGTRRYTIDSASSRNITDEELRALAFINDLPKDSRQELALAVTESEETNLPEWAIQAKRPVRATVYRSLQGQDVLIVSVPPLPFEPKSRYEGFGTYYNAQAYSGWWNPLYNGWWTVPWSQTSTRSTGSVPEPSTLALLLGGIGLIRVLTKRQAERLV